MRRVQYCGWMTVLVGVLLGSGMWATEPCAVAASKAPQASPYRPLAMVLIPSLERSAVRVGQMMRQLNADDSPLLQKPISEFWRQLGPSIPGLSRLSFGEGMRSLVRGFGIDMKQPLGLFVWTDGRRMFPLLSVGMLPSAVPGFFELLADGKRVQVTLSPTEGRFRYVLARRTGQVSRIVGCYVDGQLLLSPPLGRTKLNVFGHRTHSATFWRWFSSSPRLPLSMMQTQVLEPRVRAMLQKRQLDMIFHVHHIPTLLRLRWPKRLRRLIRAIPAGRRFERIARSATFGFAVGKSLRWVLSSSLGDWLMRYLSVLDGKTPNANWAARLPDQVGWAAHVHFNVAKLRKIVNQALSGDVVTRRFLPSRVRMQIRLGLGLMTMQARAFGFDLDDFLPMLSGQFVTGFLQSPDIRQRIQVWRKKRGFQGHLRGLFWMVGMNKAKQAEKWLGAVSKVFQIVKPRLPKRFSDMHFSTANKQGIKILKIQPSKNTKTLRRPMFLIAYQNMLVFAGDARTRDAFLRVWTGKASSLAQAAKSSPLLQKLLLRAQYGAWAFMQPQLLSSWVPDAQLGDAMPVISTLGLLSIHSRRIGRELLENYQVDLQPARYLSDDAPTSRPTTKKTTKTPSSLPTSQPRQIMALPKSPLQPLVVAMSLQALPYTCVYPFGFGGLVALAVRRAKRRARRRMRRMLRRRKRRLRRLQRLMERNAAKRDKSRR